MDLYYDANPEVYYAVAAKESGKIVLWLGEYICKDSAAQRKREVEPLFATHVDVEVLEFTI